MAALDAELRDRLSRLNSMFDNVIEYGEIPPPSLPEVDISTSQDFPAMHKLLIGKIKVIEKSYAVVRSSIPTKYDATTIRNKIALKRRELVALKSDNASLSQTCAQQERALAELTRSRAAMSSCQENVERLREGVIAAQKEIRLMERRRTELLANNRQLRAQRQAIENAVAELAGLENEEAIAKRQKEIAERKIKEQNQWQEKLQALQKEKDELVAKKTELAQRVKEKQKQLQLIPRGGRVSRIRKI
jgi:chromosome segregation ATPase